MLGLVIHVQILLELEAALAMTRKCAGRCNESNRVMTEMPRQTSEYRGRGAAGRNEQRARQRA